MIKKEFLRTRKDGVKLYKTYSDKGMKVQKLGTEEVYDEAIDVETAPFVYAETEIEIEKMEPNNTAEE